MSAGYPVDDYAAVAFHTYEDMRAQRDEAIQQRDVARDWTVALEQENAQLLAEIDALAQELAEERQR